MCSAESTAVLGYCVITATSLQLSESDDGLNFAKVQ